MSSKKKGIIPILSRSYEQLTRVNPNDGNDYSRVYYYHGNQLTYVHIRFRNRCWDNPIQSFEQLDSKVIGLTRLRCYESLKPWHLLFLN